MNMPCFSILDDSIPTFPTNAVSKSGWWGIAFPYVSGG